MFYITGDTHGNFDRIFNFCKKYETTKDDVLIILGDSGINFWQDSKDDWLKHTLNETPITIFAIHGNHDIRPYNIPTYKETIWNNGTVYVESEYPNILFAKDGEIYNFNDNKVIVIGGAYSVDKFYRQRNGWPWFEDEQPNDIIKQYVESQLDMVNWNIDTVLTHTVPLKYEPTEVFLNFIDQSTVDKSTESWLDTIENRLTYKRWFAGHYHTEKSIDRLRIMFNDIIIFE